MLSNSRSEFGSASSIIIKNNKNKKSLTNLLVLFQNLTLHFKLKLKINEVDGRRVKGGERG